MVTLRIADIVVTMAPTDPGIRVSVDGAAARFAVPDAGRVDMLIHVGAEDTLHEPLAVPLFDSGSSWRLYRDGSEFLFSFRSTTLRHSPYRLARFDETFAAGAITVTREFADAYPAGVPALQYPLDELLWNSLLARGRGIEIHGCGVLDTNGQGLLFAGQSGAGKSTIARPWRDAGGTVLSDDRVVVRRRHGRPWIYGTPWHGEEQLASPAAAPLQRVLFLAHGRTNTAQPLSPAAAAARLLACAFPPFHDRAAIDYTTRAAAEIASAVPCAALAFEAGPDVVTFVRGLA